MKKDVDFSDNCDKIVSVMRDTDKYVYFLNTTFKVEKNPTYTGNHFMARVNSVLGNTYPLGTTEQEMIDEYHNSVVIEKDLDGKTVRAGDIHRVVEIINCFEDRSPKGRFHKDNYK